MKRFNVTGVCIPEKHYMVNIENKLLKIEKMIENQEYFTINRPRQYGKTTTMFLLEKLLEKKGYLVIRLSFEAVSDETFENEEKFIQEFFFLLKNMLYIII